MSGSVAKPARRALSLAALSLAFAGCGGDGAEAHDTRESAGTGGFGASGGGGRSGDDSVLDCPELCREVEECSGETDRSCGGDCETTLTMADSLGCGPHYARYVNCVLEIANACSRERPPECDVAYEDLDVCLCSAAPENCAP